MEAQEFFQSGFCPQFPSSSSDDNNNNHLINNNNNAPPASLDHFIVEDFFDFSNDDAAPIVADNTATFDSLAGNSTDSSSAATALDSTHSSASHPNFLPTDAHFSSDLPVPCDDIAELEWLSNFAEESFSSEDLQKMQLITGMKARNDVAQEAREFQPEPNRSGNPVLSPQVSVPAKARSKRPRGPPCNWASRLLVLSPPPTAASSSSQAEVGAPKKAAPRRRDAGEGSDGRKCLHCATDKTPQWRTGPMGPKTLCNACGVRYKSGRLVPEYRPAASPTFVLTKHSNSHRKVLELRRQKEMMRAHQQQLMHHHHHHHQAVMFDVSSNGDDYLIHQHVGPDFAQLI